MVAEDLVLTVAEVNDRLPLVRSIVRDIVELHQDITGVGSVFDQYAGGIQGHRRR